MLTRLGTRQGKMADKALGYLCRTLRASKVDFVIESFSTCIPMFKKAELVIDEKRIGCVGCGLTSGRIPTTSTASSLVSSRLMIDTPVIYCNAKCPVPSPTNFSFAPAIGVSPAILKRLVSAKSSRASLVVKKQKTIGHYLLVGNMKDPKTLVFSHYDSLGPGAVDNASGTAIALSAAAELNRKGDLGSTLFVFDGNEEVSYDYPTYWGHGYREFEKRYSKLLKKAERIIVADCVGQGKSAFIKDPHIVNLAFPLKGIHDLKGKISILSGNFEKLMAVYHSELDLSTQISGVDLERARKLLVRACSGR